MGMTKREYQALPLRSGSQTYMANEERARIRLTVVDPSTAAGVFARVLWHLNLPPDHDTQPDLDHRPVFKICSSKAARYMDNQ
jgi:hypothetical protein